MNSPIYKRCKATNDPILKAVLAEIHKTAQKPDKGFLTVGQWTKKWGYNSEEGPRRIIAHALKIGIMERRGFRVVTKGRLRLMWHYGRKKSK